MNICYLPGRESSYVRTRVLLHGMRSAGLTVFDCSFPKRARYRYLVSFCKFLFYKGKSDVVFVGFLGQPLMPLVRLFTRKKIIFEAFLSVYQTLAYDRKSIAPGGLIAKIVRFFERLSCRLSDVVLLDTNQHIDYFLKEYHLDRQKFRRLFLGADDTLMYPRPQDSAGDFLVHFHGEFQALHGAKYIVEAARLLPEINFQMIGKGKELAYCLELAKRHDLKNIRFIPPVRFDLLPGYIHQAAVCLGIFGETQKTRLVIPLKVYEALAMGKPIVTADTPAVRELLTHRENVYLCEAANPASLANAIKELYSDGSLRQRIANNGFEIFQKKCSPQILGQEVLKISRELLAEGVP